MENTHINKEYFKATSENILDKVKELVHAGNVRKITIKNKDDETILVIPLTLGVVGAVIAPMFAAVGALAALVAEFSIEVEREEKGKA